MNGLLRGKPVFILAVFLLAISAPSLYAGWEQQDAGVTVNINDVTASHSDIRFTWVCGDSGTIVYTSDGGSHWTIQPTGTTQHLRSIAYIERETAPVIAVGDSGVILRQLDGQTEWTRIEVLPTTQSLRCISDAGDIIVGDSGTILKSTDIGLTWTLAYCPTTVRLNSVGGLFGRPLIAGDSGVALSTGFPNDTLTFGSTGTTRNLYGVPMFSTKRLLLGDSGLILRSTNSGVSWNSHPSPTTANLRAAEYSLNNTSHIYVIGHEGTILKTTDEGASWVTQISGTTRNLNGTFFYLDDWNGWAVGDSGTILRTRDGGDSTVAAVGPHTALPQALTLHQNYPNPFNPSTEIRFDLPAQMSVQLKILNVLGQTVAVLVDEVRPSGSHTLRWDGRNAQGVPVSSGMYLCRLQAGNWTDSKKMLLLK